MSIAVTREQITEFLYLIHSAADDKDLEYSDHMLRLGDKTTKNKATAERLEQDRGRLLRSLNTLQELLAKSVEADKLTPFEQRLLGRVKNANDKWSEPQYVCPECGGVTESAWNPCDDCVHRVRES